MTEPLADRWHALDFPVLLSIARRLECGDGSAHPHPIAEELAGCNVDDVIASFKVLNGRYIEAVFQYGDNRILSARATSLTERGLRATGLWPREDEAAEALVDLLNQAADSTSDEDDACALRKAGRLLKSVPGSVLSDITAALIRQQAGL